MCVCVFERVSYVLGVLHSQDLLSEVLKVVEGGLSRDGVDQSETLTVLHVQVSHRRELLLQTDRSHTDRQVVREALCGQRYVDARGCVSLVFILVWTIRSN